MLPLSAPPSQSPPLVQSPSLPLQPRSPPSVRPSRPWEPPAANATLAGDEISTGETNDTSTRGANKTRSSSPPSSADPIDPRLAKDVPTRKVPTRKVPTRKVPTGRVRPTSDEAPECVRTACEEFSPGRFDHDCCAYPEHAFCAAGFVYSAGERGCGYGFLGTNARQRSTCCTPTGEGLASATARGPQKAWFDGDADKSPRTGPPNMREPPSRRNSPPEEWWTESATPSTDVGTVEAIDERRDGRLSMFRSSWFQEKWLPWLVLGAFVLLIHGIGVAVLSCFYCQTCPMYMQRLQLRRRSRRDAPQNSAQLHSAQLHGAGFPTMAPYEQPYFVDPRFLMQMPFSQPQRAGVVESDVSNGGVQLVPAGACGQMGQGGLASASVYQVPAAAHAHPPPQTPDVQVSNVGAPPIDESRYSRWQETF